MQNLKLIYAHRAADQPAVFGYILLSCPAGLCLEEARKRVQRRLVLGKMLRNDIGLPALEPSGNGWYELASLGWHRGNLPAEFSLAELVRRLKIAEPFWKSALIVQEILALLEKSALRKPAELPRALALLQEAGLVQENYALAIGMATAWVRARADAVPVPEAADAWLPLSLDSLPAYL